MHADPMMWVAGVRALYLQALHPGAVRGVMQNSDFRRDAWGRLIRTARFVSATTYGTTETAHKAGARVRKVHSCLTATGRRYGVDEPALLLWVHCAEIDSYLHVVRRSGFPLTDAQADRYIAEQCTAAAPLVGLDPRDVPADRAQLTRYFESVQPELAAGPEARDVDAFLRRPPVHPLLIPVREVLWRHVARLAYAALPPYAHRLYGRSAPPPARVTLRLRVTGALLRRVPGRVRWQLPPKNILRAMARLGPGSRPGPYKLRPGVAILDEPGEGAAR
jgi:uncharacterized protein (DUF2236 family)